MNTKNRRRLTFLTVGLLFVSFSGFHLTAQESLYWNQFRGPNATGLGATGNYPSKLETGENLGWRTEIPPGVSSPCIWKNHLFVTAHDFDRAILEVIGMKRDSGQIQWRTEVPVESIEQVHEVSSPANATPATNGKYVFVYFESFGLKAFDFDGNEAWSCPLPPRQSRFGSGTSPIIADGLVILNRDWRIPRNGGDIQPRLIAVSAENGDIVWSTPRKSTSAFYSTPVVWQKEDRPEVLVLASERLTSYDLQTGRELWYVENLPPQACATPTIADSMVYVTATGMFGEPEAFLEPPPFAEVVAAHDADYDGQLSEAEIPDELNIIDRRASDGAGNSPIKQFFRGIDRDGNEKIDDQEWKRFQDRFGGMIKRNEPGTFAIQLGGEGDVSDQNIVWENPRGVAEVPSLLVLVDRMFLVRNGGIVHCRDLETGKDKYKGRLGPIGGYYASPVAADGKVYFASDRGVITVIDGRTDQLKILSTNDLGERIMATPALVDGIVYIRTESAIYAFGR